MPHSGGVPVASDWTDRDKDDPIFGLYKRCGFWTMAEAGILFGCAQYFRGKWLDIGAHTGWTAAHVAAAHPDNSVMAVEPMFAVPDFRERAEENLRECGIADRVLLFPGRSDEFRQQCTSPSAPAYAGVCIDGDHDSPHPHNDATIADSILGIGGVVLFHDSKGGPVQDGVRFLVGMGYRSHYYDTVHGVTVCWRGEDTFVPPKAMGR